MKLFFLLSFFSLYLFSNLCWGKTHTIVFRYPKISPLELEKTLEKNSHKVAVIIGAGINGLETSLQLSKTKLFDFIFIIENRDNFDRHNIITRHPATIQKMHELGFVSTYFENAYLSKSFHLFKEINSDQLNNVEVTKDNEPLIPIKIDYSQDLQNNIYTGSGRSHFPIKISRLQQALMKEVLNQNNIYILNGTGKVSGMYESDDKIMHSINFQDKYFSYNFQIKHPQLIVIAEGIHSYTRQELGISFKEVPGTQEELWCSGTVDVKNFLQEDEPISQQNHASVLYNTSPTSPLFVFGVFKSQKKNHLFILAQSNADHKFENSSHCVQFYANKVLEYEANHAHLSIYSPKNYKDIPIVSVYEKFIKVQPQKAGAFTKGCNIVLIGDSAAVGTPKGGIGASLSPVYAEAIKSLAYDFTIPELMREMALNKFSKRIHQITDFWHARSK